MKWCFCVHHTNTPLGNKLVKPCLNGRVGNAVMNSETRQMVDKLSRWITTVSWLVSITFLLLIRISSVIATGSLISCSLVKCQTLAWTAAWLYCSCWLTLGQPPVYNTNSNQTVTTVTSTPTGLNQQLACVPSESVSTSRQKYETYWRDLRGTLTYKVKKRVPIMWTAIYK